MGSDSSSKSLKRAMYPHRKIKRPSCDILEKELTTSRMRQADRKLMKKVWIENTTTKNDLIRANCFECVGFENPLVNVGKCKVYRCTFWHMRPYKYDKEEDKKESQEGEEEGN